MYQVSQSTKVAQPSWIIALVHKNHDIYLKTKQFIGFILRATLLNVETLHLHVTVEVTSKT